MDDCGLNAVKDPVKPLLYIKSFDIPGNPKTFEASVEIVVPADVDPGDYHFMIRVTDSSVQLIK